MSDAELRIRALQIAADREHDNMQLGGQRPPISHLLGVAQQIYLWLKNEEVI